MQYNTDINSFFYENKYCPLCQKKNYELKKSNYRNVYSELISKYLKIEEKKLFEISKYFKCTNCSTFYWQREISKKLRIILYEEILPDHPKGLDSSGKFFSTEGFKEKLIGLEKDPTQKSRILNGYISSFNFKDKKEKDLIIDFFADVDNKEKPNLLSDLFKRGPKNLSRHAGFRKTILNDFICKKIEKTNSKTYDHIEYGCQYWGPINSLYQDYSCLSIIPNKDVFWHKYPYEKNKKFKSIFEKDINHLSKDFKDSNLSLILVLDHIEYPIDFLKRFLNLGISSISLIVEKIDDFKGLPIQHLTGWSKNNLRYIASYLDLKVELLNDEDDNYIFAFFSKKNN